MRERQIFKGRMTENFPELKKDMSLQTEEVHHILSKINKNNIIFNMTSISLGLSFSLCFLFLLILLLGFNNLSLDSSIYRIKELNRKDKGITQWNKNKVEENNKDKYEISEIENNETIKMVNIRKIVFL